MNQWTLRTSGSAQVVFFNAEKMALPGDLLVSNNCVEALFINHVQIFDGYNIETFNAQTPEVIRPYPISMTTNYEVVAAVLREAQVGTGLASNAWAFINRTRRLNRGLQHAFTGSASNEPVLRMLSKAFELKTIYKKGD